MKSHTPRHLPPGFLNQVPAKIEIAFRALAYCRSVSDPHSVQGPDSGLAHGGRRLTSLEKGMEASALNLVRNYLNGELLLGEGGVGLPGGFDPGYHEGCTESVDHGDEGLAA